MTGRLGPHRPTTTPAPTEVRDWADEINTALTTINAIPRHDGRTSGKPADRQDQHTRTRISLQK